MDTLLSIVIPTYNRPAELLHSLNIFVDQVSVSKVRNVEIIIVDDSSNDQTRKIGGSYSSSYRYIKYARNKSNIGLEANLINAAKHAKGEYIWIFGDDDYLEGNDALTKIIQLLKAGEYKLFMLNKIRRNKELTMVLSDDCMGIKGSKNRRYDKLSDFITEWGLISGIGFITACIMKRSAFIDAENPKFYGTMYPQVGMMVSAFHREPVLLIADILICHRTQTQLEKSKEFSEKENECLYMGNNTNLRDALYFGAPWIIMLNTLVEQGALRYGIISAIEETTVIRGRLIDFLFANIVRYVNLGYSLNDEQSSNISHFFSHVKLTDEQAHRIGRYSFMERERFSRKSSGIAKCGRPTISVITPSYNQASYLIKCLDSVFDQTLSPIEHIILDPGSNDGSREIAFNYSNTTLIAEKDTGQGDAVAKGIGLARGDIVAWINSDDMYYDSKVFETVSNFFADDSNDVDFLYGKGIYLNEEGDKIRDAYVNPQPSSLVWRLQQECGIMQPAVFFRRTAYNDIGELSRSHHFCMDYEYWVRAIKAGKRFQHVDRYLAIAHYHSQNKTYGQRKDSYEETIAMLFHQYGYVNHVWLRRYAEFLVEGFDGVIAHPGSHKIQNEERVDQAYKDLLHQYNSNATTISLLQSHSPEKGYGDTLRELVRLNLLPEHYGEISISKTPPKVNEYDMGGRRWRFDAGWRSRQLERTQSFFKSAHALKSSDTCIVLCNGPSLNYVDPDMLKSCDVIGSNNIFLKSELLEKLSYYTVVNYLVAEQSAPFINGIENAIKVIPWWLGYCINEGENTYYVLAKGFPKFSTDINKNISWRHTVTFFNLQLAYGLGYKRVLLVGCDHHYEQKDGVMEQDIIEENVEDVNHFDPRYFMGKKWQAADTHMMEEMYKLAKEAYEKEGREIVNCTVGGRLELFRRSSLGSELHITPEPFSTDEFPRNEQVHVSESELVFRIFSKLYARCAGAVMIDVGAHRGDTLSPFLGSGWKVIAFEPDPENRKHLAKRYNYNPLLVIDERAISDEESGHADFYTSRQSSSIGSLAPLTNNRKRAYAVSVTTLKHVAEEHNLLSVDFLKIGTEGYDLPVLEGLPWDKIQPRVILCEFEDRKTQPLGYSFHDLAAFLRDRGYAVFVSEWHPVAHYGLRRDWRRLVSYPCQLRHPAPAAWGNLIAFREAPGGDTLRTALEEIVARDRPATVSKLGVPAGSGERPPADARPAAAKKPGLAVRLAAIARNRHARLFVTGRLASPTAAGLFGALALVGAGIVGGAGSVWLLTAGLAALGLIVMKEAVLWRWRREQDRTQAATAARALSDAIAAERARSREALAEALAAERDAAARALSEAVSAERARSQEALSEAVSAERARVERALAAERDARGR